MGRTSIIGISLVAALVAACAATATQPRNVPDAGAAAAGDSGVTLRLGYFPNVTHAPAIVGVGQDIFADALGPDVTLETATFNAGPTAVEAILTGAIDATYIGPNPAINAFATSNGEAVRIVAGSTSGGAFLVVRPDISSPADLPGARLATPQLGNTQDVALRTWLATLGLATTLEGGGDVSILPQENAQTLESFKAGQIDGAWVPEPWASRLIIEGGGQVLVDERDLWPGGRYVTTHLIVRTAFLDEHPDAVRRLLAGHVAAIGAVNADPTAAQGATNAGIADVTGKRLDDAVLAAAWKNLNFTVDPVADSLAISARHAEAAGLLDPVDLTGIYDLTLLNEVLIERGLDTVDGL
jgi:NitT/TauT family transport system substrate-binding protein